MTTYLLDAGRAAWVSEERPQDSYFNVPTMALDGTGGDEKRAFIWFPNPVSRRSDVVLRAVLTINLTNAWTANTVITVKRVTQTWTQRDVKWGASGSNPNVTTLNQATDTVVNGATGDRVDIDVTAMMQDVAAGGNWYGFRIEVDTQGANRFASPDHSTARWRPRLSVDITTAPDAPDSLRPNGVTFAISDAFPVFRWEYSSSDVNAYQAESQVQVTEVEGNYTTVAYDSDWQTNDLTDWDTALDVVPPAFLDNTQYYWRVKVRDQNGQESAWSDEATFIRASLGDVVITSPEQDNDDTSDNSPTVTWYTDDMTQTQTRIRVYDGTGNTLGDLLYERPWAADGQDLDGSGNPIGVDAYTIPSTLPSRLGKGDPIIVLPNNRYAVEVAVRDEYARRDDDFVADVRYFDYVPDLSITAPAGATVSGSIGVVTFGWTRASTPDFFTIYRNGTLIETVVGADVFVSGTSYSYIDYTAKPNTAYVYSVRAKNATGAQSAAATASSITVSPKGVWLYDPDRDIRIPILGNEEIAQELSETSVAFEPLNRNDPVRVVARIGGYNGGVSGTIAPYLTFSVQSILDDLEEVFSERSTAKLRLVFGSRNIAVNVGGLSVSQHPVPAGDASQYDVSFTYWQVGNFTT